MLGNSNGFAATTRNSVHQRKPVTVHTEDGNRATSGVHGQQKRAILAKGQRSLRGQWIGGAATTSTARCETASLLQRAIHIPFVGNHFVARRGIRHDKHRPDASVRFSLA